MTRAPALLMFIALAAVPARAEEPPRKIASINLCGDQFLIALAQPQQIGGISAFSLDPTLSVMPTQARAHPILNQRSESAIAMQPDLVLAGPHERSALRRAVEQLGIRVSEVAIISNLEDARAQILRVATFIGQPARGERLAAELDAARRRLSTKRPAHPRTALLIERRGYTAGPESLAAALLREAGFETPRGAPPGLGGFVSLEHVIAMNPDFLVTYEASEQARDQGELFLTHPALRTLFPPERRFVFPRRYSLCGGPALVEALDYLAEHQLGKM